MLIAIDTYRVSIDGGTPVRVPERNLESFIHVLLFNGFDNLTIHKEDVVAGRILGEPTRQSFRS